MAHSSQPPPPAADDLAALMAAAENPAIAAAPQASGFLASAARAATFWRRAATIYGGYKAQQLKASVARAAGASDESIKTDWTRTHEWAGAEMRDLALGLGGFYLKVGQLLSNRVDFVAPPVCKALAVLFDAVPPMPAEEVRAIIEAELGGTVESFFDGLDLAAPIGSASIAQVHRATLRANGAPVAVKVARPGSLVMLEDLSNIRVAAAYLERTELAFDLTAAVDELANQVRREFDFRLEAAAQDAIGDSLRAAMGNRITVPRTIPGLATQKVLVMEFIPGTPLHRLAATTPGLPAAVRRSAAEKIILTLVDAYGVQLLGPEGLFQADPHPGNVLVDAAAGGRVGLLDFGQTKQLTREQQVGFARLTLALAAAGDTPLAKVPDVLTPAQRTEVVEAMAELGIETELTSLGAATIGVDAPPAAVAVGLDKLRVAAAVRMMDSRGRVQPFAPDSTIKKLRTKTFPPSLFFVLRTVQMLRGLATAAGVEVSVSSLWAGRAAAVLGRPPPAGTGSGIIKPPRAWVGGPVPGGLAAADRAWADGLLKGRKVGRVAPAWAAPAWAAAHLASLTGAVAAVRAVSSLAAAAPLLALYFAALVLQVSWPAMLLTARRPAYAFGHGLAALTAALGAAAFAAAASPLAAALLLPFATGLSAGVFVSGVLWRSAAARPVEPWVDEEEEEEEGGGGAPPAPAAPAAPRPPPAAAGVGVAAAVVVVAAPGRPPVRSRLGLVVRPRLVPGRGRGGVRGAGSGARIVGRMAF